MKDTATKKVQVALIFLPATMGLIGQPANQNINVAKNIFNIFPSQLWVNFRLNQKNLPQVLML
jgi:hypothetical protein